jgi:hypothetical protein
LRHVIHFASARRLGETQHNSFIYSKTLGFCWSPGSLPISEVSKAVRQELTELRTLKRLPQKEADYSIENNEVTELRDE